MKRTKKTILLLSCGMILAIVFLFLWGIPYTDNALKKEFAFFYNSNLDGVIDKVGIKYHTTSFKLLGISHEFIFYPEFNIQIKGNVAFDDAFKPGDRIIKHAQSDTVTVIHLTKVYKYTFSKNF